MTLVNKCMNDGESPDKYSRFMLNKEIVLPTTDITLVASTEPSGGRQGHRSRRSDLFFPSVTNSESVAMMKSYPHSAPCDEYIHLSHQFTH